MKKLLSAAAIAALLVQPVIADAKDAEPVKISGSANAKGVTTVAVGAFNVGFIFESIDQTAATGGIPQCVAIASTTVADATRSVANGFHGCA